MCWLAHLAWHARQLSRYQGLMLQTLDSRGSPLSASITLQKGTSMPGNTCGTVTIVRITVMIAVRIGMVTFLHLLTVQRRQDQPCACTWLSPPVSLMRLHPAEELVCLAMCCVQRLLLVAQSPCVTFDLRKRDQGTTSDLLSILLEKP